MSSLAIFLASLTYVGDVSVNQMEHHWGKPDDVHAHFNYQMKSIGLTTWYKNLGFRVAYGVGEEVGTLGNYAALVIDFESVTSFELMYKQSVGDFDIFTGVGTYLMPMPRYFKETHLPEKNDADDDEGYFIGITYNLTEDLSVSYRYTHYSQINSEYTKGNGIHLNYRF